jgi:hypothetical protein
MVTPCWNERDSSTRIRRAGGHPSPGATLTCFQCSSAGCGATLVELSPSSSLVLQRCQCPCRERAAVALRHCLWQYCVHRLTGLFPGPDNGERHNQGAPCEPLWLALLATCSPLTLRLVVVHCLRAVCFWKRDRLVSRRRLPHARESAKPERDGVSAGISSRVGNAARSSGRTVRGCCCHTCRGRVCIVCVCVCVCVTRC